MRSHLYQKKYFYSIVYCLLRLGQNYVNNQCFVSCPDKTLVLFPVVGLSLSVSLCVVFLYCYECCPQGPFVLFFRAF